MLDRVVFIGLLFCVCMFCCVCAQQEKKWDLMKREDLAQINQQFNQMEAVSANAVRTCGVKVRFSLMVCRCLFARQVSARAYKQSVGVKCVAHLRSPCALDVLCAMFCRSVAVRRCHVPSGRDAISNAHAF